MGRLFPLAVVLGVSYVAAAQVSVPPRHQTVEIQSGDLKLKAYLWTPPGRGPFPAVVFNHGRSDRAEQYHVQLGLSLERTAEILGPVYVKHGFVFLYPFRRGEGPSADQGRFVGDLLQNEEAARGLEARMRLQLMLTTTDHLQDATSALSYLKNLPSVDRGRVAVVGHSFGGQLTLFEAARDPSVRASVAFSPAAGSWEASPALRDRLIDAVRALNAPVMLIQTENDYSLSPVRALAAELSRLHKPHVRTIYPAFGPTPTHGHNFFFLDIDRWERDVFAFLDTHLKPSR